MSRHDANRLTYDEVTIFGVPALFTDLRVDRSTVRMACTATKSGTATNTAVSR